jgi:two-component system phosphate regulon sensor histidine kinase PhoR
LAQSRAVSGDIILAVLGVWAVVLVAIALEAAGVALNIRRQIVARVGALVTGLIVYLGVRRSQSLRRLEAAARAMATAQSPGAGEAAPPMPGEYGELAPLAGALAELRRRIEDQLKEVAKKTRNLEALIEAMDEPVLATDSADRVLICNGAAEQMFHSAAHPTLRARPIAEVFTQAELLEMHADARAGRTSRTRVRLTTPLGARVFQVSASPVPVAWGEGIFGAVVVLRDVTELDQAVQVKTDFVANASHELRTPVAAIKGAAETLLGVGGTIGALDDPAMARRLVSMIQSHALRLEEMLRDLLDLSRLESPDVPLTIAPLSRGELEGALRSLFDEDAARRNLVLEFELEEELEGARTDTRLLLLILRNLLENAVKFAYEHTTVRLHGTLVEERAAPRHGIARFEVIDRGIGIPLAQQERVFERYYQVDAARTGTGSAPARRGTGLGLAIVKHGAKALGGRCGLTSVWKEGTTAWVEVPVEF